MKQQLNESIKNHLDTMRKINRALMDAEYGHPVTEPGLEDKRLSDLHLLKYENDLSLEKLYGAKKLLSPFKDVVPTVSTDWTAGAICYDTWGYEQTNIDFYCVVKRTGGFLTILPMKKVSTDESQFMTRKNLPGEIDFTAEPIKKKLKGTGFSIRNYANGGWVSLYDGKPKNSTHYA